MNRTAALHGWPVWRHRRAEFRSHDPVCHLLYSADLLPQSSGLYSIFSPADRLYLPYAVPQYLCQTARKIRSFWRSPLPCRRSFGNTAAVFEMVRHINTSLVPVATKSCVTTRSWQYRDHLPALSASFSGEVMIHTVTLNPALDYQYQTHPDLQLGEVSRAQLVPSYDGGKGINVSALLTRLGIPNGARICGWGIRLVGCS